MAKNRLIGVAVAALVVLALWYAGSAVGGDDASRDDQGSQVGSGSSDGESATVVSTHDGDTLRVRLDGVEERVRIVGYDSPEVGEFAECGGDDAADALADLLSPGDEIVLVADPTQDSRDDYDRLLRYVETPDGKDVGEAVIAAGWGEVRVYGGRPNERHAAYQDAEREAQDADLGMWGDC